MYGFGAVPMYVPQGWQCPICKRVYSPMTPSCYFCPEKMDITITTTATNATTETTVGDTKETMERDITKTK